MIDLKETTPTQKNLLKRLENRDWLEDNFQEIQEKYGEKWIAIADKKIVAHGPSSDDVKKSVKGSFSTTELLLLRVPTGEISQPA